MLDRIKALIAARQLSPSQFADLTTLPRPVVSHILSGRNKPSLEAAQKIMTAFPDVSIDWLLNGRGEMVGGGAVSAAVTPAPFLADPTAARTSRRSAESAPVPPSAPTPAPIPSPPVLPESAFAPSVASAPSPPPAAAPDLRLPAAFATKASGAPAAAVTWGGPLMSPPPPLPSTPPPPPSRAQTTPLSPPVSPTTESLSPPPPAVVQQVVRADRAVRRILVFYSDGTFSDHRPLPADEVPFF